MKTKKELQKFRAKEELKLKLLELIRTFKSKEEPHTKLTNNDIINVLSSIIDRAAS